MRVAFYAPLKPPDHLIPSGDRQMARGLVQALQRSGHRVEIASRFRAFDRAGDPGRQKRLAALGDRLARRYASRHSTDKGRAPDLWFTYHLYYKAPDWIGPQVSRALDIPYVVAEASVSPRQQDGPWGHSQRQVTTALQSASGIVVLNPRDEACVAPYLNPSAKVLPLAPFLDCAGFSRETSAVERTERNQDEPVELVTVAMMREGDKFSSYRILAEALSDVRDLEWRLTVAGGGARSDAVRTLYADFNPERVRFVGTLDPTKTRALLADSDLFVWPAVNEAFGMAFLEAQCMGLPVVAGRSEGVAQIVEDGSTGLLAEMGSTLDFSRCVRQLLTDKGLRRRMALEAVRHVKSNHDVAAAGGQLDRFFRQLVLQ